MNEAVLEVRGLTKRIGNKNIIDNLSFTVHKGEIFGLLGPNGAGKTTTIRMIVGLISKSKGSVLIDGIDAEQDFVKVMMQIGAIVENPEMFNYLTGYQNLVHFARMARSTITRERLDEVIKLVDLQTAIHRKVKTYSLGMKQRLGVAQAILHRPALLILDEPTNGLDPQGIYDFRESLRLLANEGISVLISSHQLSEMQLMCDRVAIIQHGKLISISTVNELTDETADRKLVQFELDIEALHKASTVISAAYPDLEVVLRDSELHMMLTRQDIPLINKLLMDEDIAVFGIKSKQSTLEEKFLEITKAGEV